LKYLDLAKTLLLGLGGMGEETLDISAYLSLVSFGISVSFVGFLLNYKEIHSLNCYKTRKCGQTLVRYL